MTFDFFNSSNLAFGAKITGAFKQLYQLGLAADSNLERVQANAQKVNEILNRNYLVAQPTNGDRPCRTNEIFDLINDIKFRIDTLEYSNQEIKVKVHIFNTNNSRITVAEGSTQLSKGYVFYKMARSNADVYTELQFVKDATEGSGNLLFEYRIDDSNHININGEDVSNLGLIPCDCSQYKDISLGEVITDSSNYTAEDYECICVVGQTNNIEINLNDNLVLKGKGNECVRHHIMYLKPDDKVSGTFSKIIKIKYNQR